VQEYLGQWYAPLVCGRYAIAKPNDVLDELLGEDNSQSLAPRFNVAPNQMAPVVVAGEWGTRRLVSMRWGLVPHWVGEERSNHVLINARIETVAQKSVFRDSFRRRRCLVAADGFYEWQGSSRDRQPFLVRLNGGVPFGFAGLWDRWTDSMGQVLETFTILTTAANTLVEPIHQRMPVILDREGRLEWLSAKTEVGRPSSISRQVAASSMEAVPVSRHVNDPSHDSPQCLSPVDLLKERALF